MDQAQSIIEMIEFIRSVEQLWASCDPCQRRFYEDEPVTSGLFDLNRYYYLAK